MGGVIGRAMGEGDDIRLGVRERDGEDDPWYPNRLWSGEGCMRRLDGELETFVPRSVLLLAVLPEPRRLGNVNGNALGDCNNKGPLDGVGQDAC